jgi:hypothetical protein
MCSSAKDLHGRMNKKGLKERNTEKKKRTLQRLHHDDAVDENEKPNRVNINQSVGAMLQPKSQCLYEDGPWLHRRQSCIVVRWTEEEYNKWFF